MATSRRFAVLLVVAALTSTAGARSPLAHGTAAFLPHVAEAARLVARHGATVWPGWTSAAPFLIRKGAHEYLVDHPAPPPGFESLPDALANTYRLDGHLTQAPVAATWLVAEVWSVAAPAPAELQRVIDTALGPAAPTIDDPTYLRVLLHEAFHAHQLTTLGGPAEVPRFGMDAPEREALAALLGSTSLDAHHIAIGEALAEALLAHGCAETRAAAARFLELRDAYRRDDHHANAAYERALEWLEGPARYADTRLALLAADDAERNQAVAPPSREAVRSQFIASLQDPRAIVGLRDRYAAFGAAQGLLLDRLLPGWQERVLPGREAIEDVLREAVAQASASGAQRR